MENNFTLSEMALDDLLAQSFLNMDFSQSKNQKIMETVANYSLNTSGVEMTTSGKSTITKALFVLAGLGLITAAYLYMSHNNTNPKENGSLLIPVEQKKKDSVQAVKEELVAKEGLREGKPFIDKEKSFPETEITGISEENESEVKEAIVTNTVLPQETRKSEKTAYTFPALTEREIKNNEKEKKKIARYAAKLPKSKYAPIPGMNFYMRTSEVTNLEYRTFLFDLLIQDKKEEFLKAKPEQDLWVNCNGTNKFDANKDLYFSGERFNDYPVVNISPEGAEMYCKWLKELISDKWIGCEVRLPNEKEWIYAAKAGKCNLSVGQRLHSKQRKSFSGELLYAKIKREIQSAYFLSFSNENKFERLHNSRHGLRHGYNCGRNGLCLQSQ
jgi:hypothetical protein